MSNESVVYVYCEDNMIEMLTEVDADNVPPTGLPPTHDYIAPPVAKSVIIRKAPGATIPKSPPRITEPKTSKTVNSAYICPICYYTTTSKAIMEKHNETHKNMKPGIKYEKCNSCDVTKQSTQKNIVHCTAPKCSYFASCSRNLKIHMKIHERKKAYKCYFCPFYSADLKGLCNHNCRGSRAEKRLLLCEVCDYRTHTPYRFKYHQRKHTGEIPTKSKLEEKPNKCKLCNYTAKDMANVHRHMRQHRVYF